MNEISKGRLDGACGYLSGPMEFVADHGVAWRRKFIELSRQAGLKLDLIDPTNKPGGKDIKIGENKAEQVKLQQEGRWLELQKYVHAYRRYDLRFVDLSDFLVVGVDPSIPQWGTGNEVYVAEAQHKPMLFICEGGLKTLPRWLFDVVELEHQIIRNNVYETCRTNVFQSVEEVVQELQMLDSGYIPMSDKWVLVRKELERMRDQNP